MRQVSLILLPVLVGGLLSRCAAWIGMPDWIVWLLLLAIGVATAPDYLLLWQQ